VDATDGQRGVALMSRGLPEHEVQREADGGTLLALTLVRGVGWLARGDLSCMDHAAGPMVPTPEAQELGRRTFEYALLLHAGDWAQGQVLQDSRRYRTPPLAFRPRGAVVVPGAVALCEVQPAEVQLVALYRGQEGLIVRVVNASWQPVQARLRPARRAQQVLGVSPLERPLVPPPPGLVFDGETVHLPLHPWQIATLLFKDG
jgi:mannosylglycerate hydrolase